MVLVNLALFSLGSTSSNVYTGSSHSADLFKRAALAADITPLGLCWEYVEGSTYVYWSYTNRNGFINIDSGPENQFTINGAQLETSTPPTNFTGGEMKNSASFSINLGAVGLIFGWTLEAESAILNGSEPAHQCPTIPMTVFIDCNSNPTNLNALPGYLSTLLPFNQSLISVSLGSGAAGSAAAVEVEFHVSESGKSSIWASNRLMMLLLSNPIVENDISALLSTTIFSVRADTSQISDKTPLPPPPPPKYEIRVGTIIGIVFNSIFGISIFIIIIFTIIYRTSAYLEERRLNKLAVAYYGTSKPLIDGIPKREQTSQDVAVNGKADSVEAQS